MRLPHIRPPAETDFHSPAHDVRVSARLGTWLGVAFLVCLVTGLISHEIQHPAAWFRWPTRPVGLYRVTQGLHVVSGVAAVPLLLFKLWSVYPRLFARPVVRSVAHAVERGSLLVLLAAAFFELGTGLLNVAQAYPWRFSFPAAHYAVGFVAVGAILVHVAVKLPRIREGWARRPDAPSTSDAPDAAAPDGGIEPERRPDGPDRHLLSRRGILGAAALSVGATVVATAGVTVPALRRVSVLGWSTGTGPQHVPVNRTAGAAGVTAAMTGDGYRLSVRWPGGEAHLSLAELAGLPQRTVRLPIACVEGWSAWATWTGVRLRDVLAAVGAPAGTDLRVESLETLGGYRASTLPAAFAGDPLTLLALRLNGEVLSPDHGYPCRLIAPNRPGVLQTKWVALLEVAE